MQWTNVYLDALVFLFFAIFILWFILLCSVVYKTFMHYKKKKKLTTEWVIWFDRCVTAPVVFDLFRSWVWSSQALYLSSTRRNPEKTANQACRSQWTHWSWNWPRNSKQCKFGDISIDKQGPEHYAWPNQLLIAFSLEMRDIFVTFSNKKTARSDAEAFISRHNNHQDSSLSGNRLTRIKIFPVVGSKYHVLTNSYRSE